MNIDPAAWAALARTHTIVADLTITANKLTGSIKIRPRRQQRTNANDARSIVSAGPPTNGNGHLPPRITSPASPQPEANARRAASMLTAIGIDTTTACRLAGLYPIDRIAEVTQVAATKRSPKGFTVEALTHHWKLRKETP